MVVCSVHNQGSITGAKAVSLKVVDILKANYKCVVLIDFPHDFERRGVLGYIKDFLSFFKNIFIRRRVIKIFYITPSTSGFAIIRDTIVVTIVKIVVKKVRIIAHYHTTFDRTNSFSKRLISFYSNNIEVIYLGEKLIPGYLQNIRTHICPNSVNDFWFKDYGVVNTTTSDRLSIGYFGRLERFKGVRCFAELAKKNGSDFIFKAMGTPVDFTPSEFPGNVIFYEYHSEHSEIINFLDSIDVLIYPTTWDAQPLVIIEALARGLVVIATDIGDIANMIPVAENLVYCDENIVSQIEQRLSYYTKNPSALKKDKEKSKVSASNRYTDTIFCENILKIFDA